MAGLGQRQGGWGLDQRRTTEVMTREEYPGLEPHRDLQEELISFIEALGARVLSGQIRVDRDLIATLWEWETGHINSKDLEYAEYVREGGVPASG